MNNLKTEDQVDVASLNTNEFDEPARSGNGGGGEVNGAALLDDLAGTLRRFVVLPEWAAEALALWTLHTYAFHLRGVTSYVAIESPEKECGKSTLLTVLSGLVKGAVIASNISPSAFFRVIEELQPTLLIDEADTLLRGNDELRGILNAGYTRSTAYVWRVTGTKGEVRNSKSEGRRAGTAESACARARSDGYAEYAESAGEGGATSPPARRHGATGGGETRLVKFSCWCPKAIAAIGQLPETRGSRCIRVRMQRKLAGEACERLKSFDAAGLRKRCRAFAARHGEAIAAAAPAIPAGLTNRAADIWEPLLALADIAGGRWPELARAAAVGCAARTHGHSPIGALLLDIMVLFFSGELDRVSSGAMVAWLNQRVGRPWAELCRGKAVEELWLARQLRPYGVRPRNIRVEGEVCRGYLKRDFEETFRRYIPRSEWEELKEEMKQSQAQRGGEVAGGKETA